MVIREFPVMVIDGDMIHGIWDVFFLDNYDMVFLLSYIHDGDMVRIMKIRMLYLIFGHVQ